MGNDCWGPDLSLPRLYDVKSDDPQHPHVEAVHDTGRRCRLVREDKGHSHWEVIEAAMDGDPHGVVGQVCPFPHAHAERQRAGERGDFGMPTLGGAVGEVAGLEAAAQAVGEFKLSPGMITPIPDSTVEFDKVSRVCNIMDEAQTLYKRKAHGYKQVDGDTADVLGAKGQFADMNRKFWRLKAMLWDEIVEPYPDKGEGESVEEILMDLIGHASLTIDYLRQSQGRKEEGTS